MSDSQRPVPDEPMSDEPMSDEPMSDEPVSDEPEDHLHPEPLAMTGDDVIHALDPEHWLPENRRDREGGEDDADHDDRERSKYPYIRSDFPAPFG